VAVPRNALLHVPHGTGAQGRAVSCTRRPLRSVTNHRLSLTAHVHPSHPARGALPDAEPGISRCRSVSAAPRGWSGLIPRNTAPRAPTELCSGIGDSGFSKEEIKVVSGNTRPRLRTLPASPLYHHSVDSTTSSSFSISLASHQKTTGQARRQASKKITAVMVIATFIKPSHATSR